MLVIGSRGLVSLVLLLVIGFGAWFLLVNEKPGEVVSQPENIAPQNSTLQIDAGSPGKVLSIDSLKLIATSPIDGNAVVKFDDDSTILTTVGQTLLNNAFLVEKIGEASLVLRESQSDVLYIVKLTDGKTVVNRIDSALNVSEPEPQFFIK